MEGISEANIIGIAAGLALNGKIPYVNTIASFLTRRCYEQVLIDICLQNLNVRLVGNGGGAVYAPLGPTHLALEDLSIMRAIPNMTVLAPCDAEEMTRLIPETLEYQGPLYIRLAKGGDQVISKADRGFKIGKAISIRKGSDALIISTGVMTQVGLAAATQLETYGISTTLLHMHTIKPMDTQAILDAAEKCRAIVTIEENSIQGGLGGAVAELLLEQCSNRNFNFKRFGFNDRFPSIYGSQADHLEHFGINADNVVNFIRSC